jgi:2-amino-4-hydroxy-6-hydroxymethyldihydropteridine diphosphokinase
MLRVRRAVIGLGSNLGDRAGTLDLAVERLGADPAIAVVGRSPYYITPPAGGPPQDDYINGAVLIETALPAREILGRALTIERTLGRVRPDPVRWGPRTIDLDILWIEGEVINEAGLVVPHPRLRERAFALGPLVDVAPNASDPATGEPYHAMLPARLPLRRAEQAAG